MASGEQRRRDDVGVDGETEEVHRRVHADRIVFAAYSIFTAFLPDSPRRA